MLQLRPMIYCKDWNICTKRFPNSCLIVLSLCDIIVLSPVFIIVAVAIVIDDPGPIFLNRNDSERTRSCL